MKFFNTSRLNKKQLRSAICQFALSLGVSKVVFNNNGKKVNGTYNGKTHVLYLNAKQTNISLLRTFFHELGHHVAVQQNKWKNYHLCLVKTIRIETMFYIENKIDQIGQKLWYKHVDIKQWGMYKYIYPKINKSYFLKTFTNN